ncbi:hypothetical protein [Rhodococcus sp. T7]|uniref:hypothetical protein n=1 Tax=Rhodococcus sp. T7 TaxID=627444 RepID=UPI00135C3FF9|nr:hypothetical protein [Rhodococcus sp. T7]
MSTGDGDKLRELNWMGRDVGEVTERYRDDDPPAVHRDVTGSEGIAAGLDVVCGPRRGVCVRGGNRVARHDKAVQRAILLWARCERPPRRWESGVGAVWSARRRWRWRRVRRPLEWGGVVTEDSGVHGVVDD